MEHSAHRVLPISVVVLAYNEELNIQYCLESVCDWSADVFVVDSGSEDRTLEIAREFGARVVHHPFETYAHQFNWALEHLPIMTPWVMRLDADEMVTPELALELRRTLPNLPPHISGLYVKRRVYFMGRWIRHGGYYPTWLLRIFRTRNARCENRWMDEHIVLLAGDTMQVQHDIVDYNRKGLRFWTIKHERYARREMLDLTDQTPAAGGQTVEGRLAGTQDERKRWVKSNVYAKAPLFLRAFLYFIYRYFFRLGFLDGVEGLVFHFLQGCWYRFYVDAKLWEARHGAQASPGDD